MLLSIFISVGLFAVSALLVYKYLTWHYSIWKEIGLPGPKPRIFYGNFPNIVKEERSPVYDFDDVYNQYKNTERAIGVFVTRNPQILILDPKLANDVMVTDFRKFRHNFSFHWIPNPKADKYAALNPFFTNTDEWKPKRADAISGLTANKLCLAYPIWKESARKLSVYVKHKFSNGAKSVEIDTEELVKRFAINVVGDFLWGIDADTLTDKQAQNTFSDMVKKMFTQVTVGFQYYFKFNVMLCLRSLLNIRLFPEETDKFFSQLTKDAMSMRRAQHNANEARADFLNHVIQLQDKKNISHDSVLGHLMTVLLNGYDTSAVMAYHTLFYLARYPKVQEKLRAEILSNLDDGDFMNFNSLTSLSYLDQCVYETIRLITPVPIYSRICAEATELELKNNKRIPVAVGTVVSVPIFSIHHDPDFYPEPYKYKPERFDNGAHIEMTKQGLLMAFGTGPRICLGMRFGLLQVKTIVVELLRAYRINCCPRTVNEKKPDSPNLIFGLAGEFWLKYEPL